MNKTYLIFRHEFLQEVKKTSYIIMTLTVPLLALLAIGIFRLVFPAPAPAQEVVQAPPQPTQGYVGDPNLANIIVPGVFALLLGLSLMLGATALINGLGEEVVSNFLSPRLHTLAIVLLARVVGGELCAADDLEAVAWFPLSGPLPEMAFEADAHICERYYRMQLEGAPVDPGYAAVAEQ